MDTNKATIVMHDEEPVCTFCSLDSASEWYNMPIMSYEDRAFVLPSVGSLIPGYMLALPSQHVTAVCKIPKADKDSFASFVETTLTRLSRIYGDSITMFEHGAFNTPRRKRSACVSHAHLHLVPGSYNLTSEAPSGGIDLYRSLREFIETDRTTPYLMLQDPGGPIVVFDDYAIPQFFRRVIAERLGITECWDYALFPFYENIRKTYHDFGCDVRPGEDSVNGSEAVDLDGTTCE